MSLDQFKPKDTDPATELEVLRTQHLQKYLQDQGLYESTEEALLREEVLGHLDQIVKDWVKGVARHLGLSESVAQEANATIFTFGSYRLGVHAPGADIDVLCVGPQYAKRDLHFFGSQPYCLETVLANVPGVEEITPVAEAYVPVMKIKFKGIEMDVLYASLAQFLIPENLDLSTNSVLRGCDEQSVRSLNGCRVTDTILRSVPDVNTFRLALKAVKLWAEKRGVYSNVSGYLGGVNMALLVAKICKWYPRKQACTIVMMVFMHFTNKYWRWPDAVHLVPQRDDPTMNLPVWNPADDRDRKSLMPIITPVYPAMNSTHNVTRCTMFVMMQEFERAFEICKTILFSTRHSTDWSPLFEPLAFFEVPKAFYVLIELIANNSADMEKWDGWVRSRVRHLVRVLEDHANVRPFPESKSAPSEEHPGDSRPRKYYFLCITKRSPQLDEVSANGITAPKSYSLQRNAGATQGPSKTSINVTQPIRNFTEQVRQWKDAKEGMEVRPLVKRQADLPAWAFPQGFNPLVRRKEEAAAAAAAAAAGNAIGGTGANGGSSAAGSEAARPSGSLAPAAGGTAASTSGLSRAASGAEGASGASAPAGGASSSSGREGGGENTGASVGANRGVNAGAAAASTPAARAARAQQAGQHTQGQQRQQQVPSGGAAQGAAQRPPLPRASAASAPASAAANAQPGSGASQAAQARAPLGSHAQQHASLQQQQQQLQRQANGAAGHKRAREEEAQQQAGEGVQGQGTDGGSTACTHTRVSTPELQAAETDSKIMNHGQDHYADWLGQTVPHMTPSTAKTQGHQQQQQQQQEQQQEQQQGPGCSSPPHEGSTSMNNGSSGSTAASLQQQQQQQQGAGEGPPVKKPARKPGGLTFNLARPTS